MNAALKLASFASNQKYVKLTPVLTMALLEAGNISHIIRMWVQHSTEGTSLIGWCCINFALILWCNFYRVMTPNEKIAIYSSLFGITVNFCAIFSIIYIRYW